MHTGNLCYSKYDYEVTNTPAKPIHACKTMTKLQQTKTNCRSDDPGGRREPRKVLKNLIQAIRREGKRLMQKGSQADNEGRGTARQ